MKNINKNLIPFFIIITFIFGLFFAVPVFADDFSIRTGITFIPDVNNNQNLSTGYSSVSNPFTINPVPVIYSISPNFGNLKSGTITITVTGTNFIQSSSVRFNYFDQPTTYINSGTLQFQLHSSDISTIGNFPITVGNTGPGGGISNAVIFKVNNNVTSNTTGTVSKEKQTSAVINTDTATDANSNNNAGNDLSANALFASNKFMPSNFFQWMFVVILIFSIIVLWRKLYTGDKYKTKPLKHA